MKQQRIEHGVLCTDDKKEWRVPDSGILLVHFVEEPNADRTLGEVFNYACRSTFTKWVVDLLTC